jgi:hypothetical protein
VGYWYRFDNKGKGLLVSFNWYGDAGNIATAGEGRITGCQVLCIVSERLLDHERTIDHKLSYPLELERLVVGKPHQRKDH